MGNERRREGERREREEGREERDKDRRRGNVRADKGGEVRVAVER
ncbi:hypothetical protein [Nocardioides sp.]|nr:hypothetical protein [Nocardioides sp.]MDI6911094.1 hypothetical protein [Nocardioides sp.]